MKKNWSFLLLLQLIGCAADRDQSQYLRWVGDIEPDALTDDETFTICHGESRVKQYFNFSKGLQYEGEKPAIVEAFRTQYKSVEVEKWAQENRTFGEPIIIILI